jgi:hypothetical protein
MLASFLFPAPALSISVSPSPPISHPQTPAHDPSPWTRPRPHVLRPRPRACIHFEPRAMLADLPSLTCTLSQTTLPSLSLCTCDQRAPPPPTNVLRPFYGRRGTPHHVSIAAVSSTLSPATWNTPRFAPNPSCLLGPRSPEFFLCSWSSTTVAPRRPYTSAVAPILQRFLSR